MQQRPRKRDGDTLILDPSVIPWKTSTEFH